MEDAILIESPTLRQKLCNEANTAILNRVGNLMALPHSGYATTEQVAAFYQVPLPTIKSVVIRHRRELEQDGYKVLSSSNFRETHDASLKPKQRFVAVFPRRAILRIGMVLVQSPVAELVRHYLLFAEKQSNAILYRQHGLMDMATQLQEQAQKLAKHSTQLVSQADLIKAGILEIYKNRDEISHNRSRIEELEVKFSVLDGSRNVDEQAYITPEQIEVLREKVKQKGRPVTIWRKFNRHFQITRYKFLPRNRFIEGLEWLEKLPAEHT